LDDVAEVPEDPIVIAAWPPFAKLGSVRISDEIRHTEDCLLSIGIVTDLFRPPGRQLLSSGDPGPRPWTIAGCYGTWTPRTGCPGGRGGRSCRTHLSGRPVSRNPLFAKASNRTPSVPLDTSVAFRPRRTPERNADDDAF
jgi:hypothetical protein